VYSVLYCPRTLKNLKPRATHLDNSNRKCFHTQTHHQGSVSEWGFLNVLFKQLPRIKLSLKVIMQQSHESPQLFTIGHPYQNAFISGPVYGAYTFSQVAIPQVQMQSSPQPLSFKQQVQSPALSLSDDSRATRFGREPDIVYTNRTTINRVNNINVGFENPIRRTRSGHVSKTRVTKRGDLTKVCPSCSKLWRLCSCSNVKNRPAPKPYCKFVPPRMLNKQMDSN
jgi:hypothetical protein